MQRPLTLTDRLLAPDAFRRLGGALLWGGFGLGLLLVLVLARAWPLGMALVPAAAVGMAVAIALFRRPLLNLYVLLVSFVLLLNYEPGVQAQEAIYGAYYLAFLGHWFVTRLFVYREPILRTGPDKAFFAFLVWVCASVGLTALYGGSGRALFSEWMAMMVLGFYFPIREACVQDPKGVRRLLAIMLWVGVFIAFRNMLEYYTDLQNAFRVYHVTNERVITNDTVLMVVALFALARLVYAQTWRTRAGLLGLFLLVFGALILTLSRGIWASFLFGAGVMFLAVERPVKVRLAVLGAVGLGGVLAVGFVLFPSYITLVLTGLVDRFTSIGSAATQDISLMARFLESKAVWERIVQSPVLGYGMGVPFSWYDMLSRTTLDRTFIHNGYLSLWYRFGIVGLGLVLIVWVSGMWRGLGTFRPRAYPVAWRLAGLSALCSLAAMVPSALTSNPFFTSDKLFAFAFVAALAVGVHERARWGRSEGVQARPPES